MFYWFFFFPFFALGAVAGSASLLAILALLGFSKRRKRKLFELAPRTFVFGSEANAAYLNMIMRKGFPRLRKSSWLHRKITKRIALIGREGSVIQAMDYQSIAFTINGFPPIIDAFKLQTSVKGDYVEFALHFQPSLVVEADIDVRVPVIGNTVRVGTCVRVEKFVGAMRMTVPERVGRIELQLTEGTKIECHVGARLGHAVNIRTESMGPIWTAVTDVVHGYLLSNKIGIKIEEMLEEKRRAPVERKISDFWDGTGVQLQLHPTYGMIEAPYF